MKLINLNIFCAAFLFSCGTVQQQASELSTSTIVPPLGISEQNLNTFTVNNESETELTTKAGSTIFIPENCFTYVDGTPVKGDLELTFKEYHSNADIILSGIPMTLDSAGVTEHFISGGMFSISGEQGEKEVKIASDKQIKVDLASINPQEDFPLWTLNEKTGEWSYLENTVGKPTQALAEMPVKPNANYSKELGLNVVIPFWQFPELRKYKSLMWQLTDSKDLEKFKGKKLKLERMNKGAKKGTYDIVIDKEGTCVAIEPIFTGPNLEAAMNSYQSEMNKLKENPNSIYYKPKMRRTIYVPNFTTYNCDIFARMTARKSVMLAATVDGKPIETLYAIDVSNSGVLCYSGEELANFTFDQQSDYLLLGISGDKIGLCKPKEFTTVKKSQDKDIVSVELEAPLNDVASEENIRNIMMAYN